MPPLLPEDLILIEEHTRPLWERLRNQSLFLTGGTGFFGRWLVESFCHFNQRLQLNARLMVLSRQPDNFYQHMPHLLEEKSLSFHRGDIRNFQFPSGEFRYIIHAATAASLELNTQQPKLMRDTIVQGTERVLQLAQACGAQRFLFTSSGAVYGQQPSHLTHVPETYTPVNSLEENAYAHGKYLAEQLCLSAAQQAGLEVVIARCFAFVGPHLPLDQHFAIGNFIRDALAKRPILLQGDGMPYRSYLYAADLTIWLWTLLFQAESGCIYNVGSDEGLSLHQIAQLVAQTLQPELDIQILSPINPDQPASRYVPCIQRANREMNLYPITPLPEALRKTAAWLRQNGGEC